MSKIGKKPINIPNEVSVDIVGNTVHVAGPKGALFVNTNNKVNVYIDDNSIYVKAIDQNNTQYQGLYRSLISNAVEGVSKGFTKKLELNGVGYKASIQNGDLVLNVGYSHPVVIKKPEGIEFTVNENIISVSGIDKVLVGDVAANIRSVRPPDPYRGKGIKYVGELLILKKVKSLK
ncbi:MAG: 50S ribosomal protein L6 [Candidatus Dojkabacteria bacterium]|nr:MAG: 50S ribosomal protein L6 [Candidatus Dojkabacteria bacterium]